MIYFIIALIFFGLSKTILSDTLSDFKYKKYVYIGLLSFGLFNFNFFYADPGNKYHVRTLLSQERVVTEMGWSYYGGGSYIKWKNAMSIQVLDTDDASASSTITPPTLVFLDQVDAKGYATTRFKIPNDKELFLRMAREYRTPENLIITELVPAMKTSLQASSGLMSAEEYFSGSKTTFMTEFEDQLDNGIFLVRREEVRVIDDTQGGASSANASKKGQEDNLGKKTKVVFQVKKQLDENGVPIRQQQNFKDYGITLVSARVTDVVPNKAFLNRMKAKQKASADNSIAREQRIQEEQQRLLEIAKGDRLVAVRQAEAKVIQIELTTKAETTKQLALTKASQSKEQAEIDKQTSQLLLEKATIDSKSVKVAADAEAYKRTKIIKSDNALQSKLDAEVRIHEVWSVAFANRKVPTTVFGGSSSPTGSDSEVSSFMKILTMQAAKSLDYNREIK